MDVKVLVRFSNPSSGGRHFMPVGDGYSPDLILNGDWGYRIPVILCGMPREGSKFDEWYAAKITLRYDSEVDKRLVEQSDLLQFVEAERVVGDAKICCE